MRFLLPLVLLAAPVFAQPAASPPPGETRGSIESVTVYRGQALVTRHVDLPAGLAAAAGTVQEVIVTDLPARIMPGSLHAEASPGFTVRSVSFRTTPVVRDTREEVRSLDAKIEDLQTKLAANRRRAELVVENRAYLMSLQGFVAPTATTEMTKGVLNAETIEKVSGYLIKQRAALADEELALASQAKALQADLDQAQRERQKIAAGSSRTVNEAVVLVARDAGGAAPSVRLRYLVDGATWEPSYNVRSQAGKTGEDVTLEYYASIQQMSGEDWANVSMTLSTATPSLVAAAPRLKPMAISLNAPTSEQLQVAYADARKDLEDRLRKVEQARSNMVLALQTQAVVPGGGGGGGGAQTRDDQAQADKSLNAAANEIQVLDLIANARVERTKKEPSPRASEEGLSVTYTLSTPATIPSRRDQQLIQIAAIPVQAGFAKIAAPVLTTFVYDEAAAANSSSLVLLAGPLTAYKNGAFVGSGSLPTVAAGQRFTAGFGIDSSLRCSRELVERTESIQGGNRVVDLTYRLTVENFADAPAAVRLLDRLPKLDDKRSDIKLTLLSPGGELCSDADYLATDRKDGILRWDVTVPPRSSGPTSFVLEYRFRLEFDKQMTIVGMGG